MSIPIFYKFLYPFLLQLKNKDVSLKEMKQALISHFHLTDEDLSLKTKSGSSSQFNDRINWSRQYLRRALLIEIPQRGVYRITQRGRDFLDTHNDVTQEDLLQFPEFANYVNPPVSVSSSTNQSVAQVQASVAAMTPTEQMDDAFKKINNDLAADLLQKVMIILQYVYILMITIIHG